jgi:hypothetical protein
MRWSVSDPFDRAVIALALGLLVVVATACSPKVGSEAWCETQREVTKSDWSANDAAAFAKHCIFKRG